MGQPFRGNAAFCWVDAADDKTSERVLRLREPVREVRLGHAQSVFRGESLDKRTVQTFTVGEGVDEFVCRVRYGDDPQGLLDLVKAGTKGRTISYFPDLGNPGQTFSLTLIAPVSPLTLGLDPDTGIIGGEQDVELRFRRTDSGAFTITDYGLNANVLFRLRGGGRVEEGTFTRADSTTCATYITKTGTVATAAANVLRTEWVDLDSDGVRETPGFLLEGSRTNSVLRSEELDNAYWNPTAVTFSANSVVAPDGTTTADTFVETAANSQHRVMSTNITITAGEALAVSVFVKARERFRGRLIAINSANTDWFSTLFNLQTTAATAEVGGSGTSSLASMQAIGGGWYRIYAAGRVDAGSTSIQLWLNIYDDSGTSTYAGDITKGLTYWGAQFERATTPSSYLRTTSATVTRAADSLTFPIGFGPQDDLTVYTRLARPVWADATGSLGSGVVTDIVNIATTPGPMVVLTTVNSGRLWDFVIYDAAGSIGTRVSSESIPSGTSLAVIGQAKNLLTAPAAAVDAGSGLTAFDTGSAAFGAWSSQTVRVGGRNASANELFGVLVDLVVARGLISLQGMQAKA